METFRKIRGVPVKKISINLIYEFIKHNLIGCLDHVPL